MDCHAFEFMQRALQDLRKTAYSLDARVRRGPPGTAGLCPQTPHPDLSAGRSGCQSHCEHPPQIASTLFPGPLPPQGVTGRSPL